MADRKKKKTSVIRQKFPKRMQKKLVLLFGAIILAFVFLIGKVTYINATNGEKYTKIVLDQQQYNSRLIPFKRGDILDRNGTVIATSERVYNVILDAYVMLAKDDDVDRAAVLQVKEAVEKCFDIKASVIDDVVETKAGSRYCILKKKISYAQAQKFEVLLKDKESYPYLSCVWLEEDYIRTYPYNTLASDVIGFPTTRTTCRCFEEKRHSKSSSASAEGGTKQPDDSLSIARLVLLILGFSFSATVRPDSYKGWKRSTCSFLPSNRSG